MAAQTLYVILYGHIFPSCTQQCDMADQTSSDQVDIDKAMEEQMHHQDVKSEEHCFTITLFFMKSGVDIATSSNNIVVHLAR